MNLIHFSFSIYTIHCSVYRFPYNQYNITLYLLHIKTRDTQSKIDLRNHMDKITFLKKYNVSNTLYYCKTYYIPYVADMAQMYC